MKTKLFTLVLVTSMGLSACQQKGPSNSAAEVKTNQEVVLKDYGPAPLVLDIDDYTLKNTNFRTTLWTGKNLQVTLMSIPVGGEVGLEVHHDLDQFLRIEDGQGKVMMGDAEDQLDFVRMAEEDDAVFVPAGKWHNIVNTGDEPLKLYSIYAPQEHPHGTVHIDKAASDADEHHH
ncbi:MAG: cupin domain-containing protein [Bacteroides sp.]|mgnify:CR=1 FL=1